MFQDALELRLGQLQLDVANSRELLRQLNQALDASDYARAGALVDAIMRLQQAQNPATSHRPGLQNINPAIRIPRPGTNAPSEHVAASVIGMSVRCLRDAFALQRISPRGLA